MTVSIWIAMLLAMWAVGATTTAVWLWFLRRDDTRFFEIELLRMMVQLIAQQDIPAEGANDA